MERRGRDGGGREEGGMEEGERRENEQGGTDMKERMSVHVTTLDSADNSDSPPALQSSLSLYLSLSVSLSLSLHPGLSLSVLLCRSLCFH